MSFTRPPLKHAFSVLATYKFTGRMLPRKREDEDMQKHRRLSLDAETAHYLNAADKREVACEDLPAGLLAFLVQQRLVRVRGSRGVDVLEVSAEGRLALLRYGG